MTEINCKGCDFLKEVTTASASVIFLIKYVGFNVSDVYHQVDQFSNFNGLCPALSVHDSPLLPFVVPSACLKEDALPQHVCNALLQTMVSTNPCCPSQLLTSTDKLPSPTLFIQLELQRPFTVLKALCSQWRERPMHTSL